jgi:very-short-patch-repair endonuclease
MIACKVCGWQFNAITHMHLKTHNMTTLDYVSKFPGAFLVSEETSALLSAVHLGKPKSDETRENMSKAQAGRVMSYEANRNNSDAQRGKVASMETRLKMSESHLGVSRSEETKRKISEAHIGKVLSSETKARIGEAHTGIPLSLEHRDSISETMTGKTHTIESRLKMSESQRGLKRSEEAKLNNSIAQTGKVVSLESRQQNRETNKANWSNPEFAKMMREAQNGGLQVTPNLCESILKNILEDNFPGYFIFSGGGGISVGSRIPDFINQENKQIIEFFGSRFHPASDEKDRTEEYSKLGYSCLCIWEEDFWIDGVDPIVSKVKTFIG